MAVRIEFLSVSYCNRKKSAVHHYKNLRFRKKKTKLKKKLYSDGLEPCTSDL